MKHLFKFQNEIFAMNRIETPVAFALFIQIVFYATIYTLNVLYVYFIASILLLERFSIIDVKRKNL